jgi:hypothetical protein
MLFCLGASWVMSALGQKQTLQSMKPMSALPPRADIGTQPRDVCFVPEADVSKCSKNCSYSITHLDVTTPQCHDRRRFNTT